MDSIFKKLAGEKNPPPSTAPEPSPTAEIIELQRHPLWLHPPAPQKTPASPPPAVRFRQIQEQLERLDQELSGLKRSYARALDDLTALARYSDQEHTIRLIAVTMAAYIDTLLKLSDYAVHPAPAPDSPPAA